jgi:hypothetical protein
MTDPDLPSKLRALYVETGANYVQAAADEIERLRAIVKRFRPDGATLPNCDIECSHTCQMSTLGYCNRPAVARKQAAIAALKDQ